MATLTANIETQPVFDYTINPTSYDRFALTFIDNAINRGVWREVTCGFDISSITLPSDLSQWITITVTQPATGGVVIKWDPKVRVAPGVSISTAPSASTTVYAFAEFGNDWIVFPSTVSAAASDLSSRFLSAEVAVPTGGAGTSGSPWTHSDGTGGINTAITAAATSGRAVFVPPGYYAVTSAVAITSSNMVVKALGAKLVCSAALTDGLAVTVIGSAGTYLENVEIDGLHLERTSGGSIRLQYVRRSQFGRITANGAGGGILSLRDTDRCQFHQIIVNEVISLSAVEEGMDMGSCSYNQFGTVLVKDAGGSGITVKTEDGATNGGSQHNHFGNVTIINHTVRGMDFGNSPATPNGTDINNYNVVDHLSIESTVSGAVGVRVASGSTNPRINGVQIRNVWIKVPGNGYYSTSTDACSIENGYIESTGALAVQVDGVADGTAVTGFKMLGVRCKSGGAGTSSGAIQLTRAYDSLIQDCEVVSSTGQGIFVARVKRCGIDRNYVHDCAHHGINFEIYDEAAWRGSLHTTIARNRVRDIGTGGGTRYALRITSAGATAPVAVRLDQNIAWDTQGTKTSRGVLVTEGTAFQYSSYVGNMLKDLVDTRSGSFTGTGSVSTPNIEAA